MATLDTAKDGALNLADTMTTAVNALRSAALASDSATRIHDLLDIPLSKEDQIYLDNLQKSKKIMVDGIINLEEFNQGRDGSVYASGNTVSLEQSTSTSSGISAAIASRINSQGNARRLAAKRASAN